MLTGFDTGQARSLAQASGLIGTANFSGKSRRFANGIHREKGRKTASWSSPVATSGASDGEHGRARSAQPAVFLKSVSPDNGIRLCGQNGTPPRTRWTPPGTPCGLPRSYGEVFGLTGRARQSPIRYPFPSSPFRSLISRQRSPVPKIRRDIHERFLSPGWTTPSHPSSLRPGRRVAAERRLPASVRITDEFRIAVEFPTGP